MSRRVGDKDSWSTWICEQGGCLCGQPAIYERYLMMYKSVLSTRSFNERPAMKIDVRAVRERYEVTPWSSTNAASYLECHCSPIYAQEAS